jgi:hypothetical protein
MALKISVSVVTPLPTNLDELDDLNTVLVGLAEFHAVRLDEVEIVHETGPDTVSADYEFTQNSEA